MNVWRVTRAANSRQPGGRWNRRGVAIAYASRTLSLAILEYLANLADRALAPSDLVAVRATISDAAIRDVTPVVPADWRTVPAPASTRGFGDRWARERFMLAALIPSVAQPDPSWAEERNVLINPSHASFADIRFEGPRPLSLDSRLL
jgi:RES domain-containing protein